MRVNHILSLTLCAALVAGAPVHREGAQRPSDNKPGLEQHKPGQKFDPERHNHVQRDEPKRAGGGKHMYHGKPSDEHRPMPHPDGKPAHQERDFHGKPCGDDGKPCPARPHHDGPEAHRKPEHNVNQRDFQPHEGDRKPQGGDREPPKGGMKPHQGEGPQERPEGQRQHEQRDIPNQEHDHFQGEKGQGPKGEHPHPKGGEKPGHKHQERDGFKPDFHGKPPKENGRPHREGEHHEPQHN